jgi:hypothetical protein
MANDALQRSVTHHRERALRALLNGAPTTRHNWLCATAQRDRYEARVAQRHD